MLLISLLSTGVAFFIISTVLIISELIAFRHSLVNELSIQARIIGNNSTAALVFNDPKAAEDILAAMGAAKNIISAVIFTKDDRIFAKYVRHKKEGNFSPGSLQDEGHHFGTDHLVLRQRIILDGETIGKIQIRSDLTQLYFRLIRFGITVFLVMSASLLVAFLLLSKLQKALTGPIIDLVKLTQTISKEKRYSLRTPVHNQDELGSLAESFNEMLAEIQKRDRELEQHRTHLEEEVAKRTAELAEANEQLQQELTERKKAEVSLKEGERFLASIFSSIQDGISILDNDLNIIRVNHIMEQWYAHAMPVVGKKCYKAYHGQSKACEICPTLQTIHSGKGAFQVVPKTGKTGEIEGWFDLYSFPLFETGSKKMKGVIEVVRDITERKRAEEDKKNLEEQLRQSQKMEAIGRLAGGVAHDFNNLLTVIKGYSQLSLLELTEENSLKKNIEEIQKAGDRASNLTRQLLAFSRRQVLEMKILNLNAVLRDLEKMVRRLIPENIDLCILLGDELGKMKSDSGQIEQVILNLVVNAKDAMPEGGKLIMQTANVTLDKSYTKTHVTMTPGQYVLFTISDTGVGMTPEVQERIFEPFFTTKETGKGTGLGLSTVYGIVKQSGGYIWVYSEPGKGTTFKIYFPRVEGEISLAKQRDDTSTLLRGNETILLVEDELPVRDLAAQVLRSQGYKVLEATNGEEGLLLAQEFMGKEIHLLLTDVVMPQMGGMELADRVKLLRPAIKVLFTSGYSDNVIVQNGVLLPGTAFLEKPFSPTTLLHKVREVLDR
jgi:PAS domain S-box-containing protein